MGKVVTFSLDGRSDRRGEHPIRLYVRSCDGHRFQSTVGYSVSPEKWDADKQRTIVDAGQDSGTNSKGIPFSKINDRIEAISKSFEALLSVPGAATKSSLASALDQITTKGHAIRGNTYSGRITSGTESPDLAIIREFLSDFHDFANKDRRKGYVNIYRPDWHERKVWFFIHPHKGKRSFVRSGAIMMKGDGSVLVQGSAYNEWETNYGSICKTFELSKCSNSDIKDLVASIQEYQSYMPDDSSTAESISSVVIPAGEKRVGRGAFNGHTELKAVSVPDGIVAIGDSAFAGCGGLEEIHLPDSVIEIGDSAFRGCAGLKSVYLPNVVKIGESAFEGCVGLIEMHIPDGVTEIGNHAFEGCTGLTEIHIPDSVTSIGEYAFEGCSGLTEIHIPDGISEIGWCAFGGCSGLKLLSVPAGVKNLSNTRLPAGVSVIVRSVIRIPDGVTSIGEHAFQGCTGLTEIHIPDSVTSIGEYAFNGCTGLTEIHIPDGVTEIGWFAFYGCVCLTEIHIPDGVPHVGYGAFPSHAKVVKRTGWRNNSNEIIHIPATVTKIGDYAFGGFSSLKEIYIPDSVTEIGDNAFENCPNLTKIVVSPDNPILDSRDNSNAIIYTEHNKLVFGCKSTMIPDGVTEIGDNAFENCTGLTEIHIPDSVTSIGRSAFQGCTGLKELHIPDSVTSIGNHAFEDCTSLTEIHIPDGVTEIGESTFYRCTSLTEIHISDGVTSIGQSAFEGCTDLKEIHIPDSVTEIGKSAFYGCSGLAEIKIPKSVIRIAERAFCYSGLQDVSIQGCVSIGSWAFSYCPIRRLALPDTLERICIHSFNKCTNLQKVSIPDKVVSVGTAAFIGCLSLKELSVPKGLDLSKSGVPEGVRITVRND